MFIVERLLGTRLEVLTKLIPLYAATATMAILVLVPISPRRLAQRLSRDRLVALVRPEPGHHRSPLLRPLLSGLAALATGACIGLITAWLLSDVIDVLHVAFTPVTRMWFAVAFAGVALGIVRLRSGRYRRRIVAAALIPAALITAAFGINVDVAAFPTLNALFHHDTVPALPRLQLPSHLVEANRWHPPHRMRHHGLLGSVRIPGTVSHFNARQAIVYLPPAALTPHPPRLPVILSLSGQPGWPTDVFINGGLQRDLDRYAQHHHGIAPIVIAADQLGLPGNNPMCLNSRLGDVDTYLTRDVPAWATHHLPVTTSRWAIEGFSEGGTCAMQLLPRHPQLFTAALAIAPEAVPDDRGEQNTIREAFDGHREQYLASTPAALMRNGAPFPADLVLIGWGTNDDDYADDSRTLLDDAHHAGMSTRALPVTDSAHDWNTVTTVLSRGIPSIATHILDLHPRP